MGSDKTKAEISLLPCGMALYNSGANPPVVSFSSGRIPRPGDLKHRFSPSLSYRAATLLRMDFDKKETNQFIFIAMPFLFLVKLKDKKCIPSPISGDDGDLATGLSLVWKQEKFFAYTNHEAESSY